MKFGKDRIALAQDANFEELGNTLLAPSKVRDWSHPELREESKGTDQQSLISSGFSASSIQRGATLIWIIIRKVDTHMDRITSQSKDCVEDCKRSKEQIGGLHDFGFFGS